MSKQKSYGVESSDGGVLKFKLRTNGRKYEFRVFPIELCKKIGKVDEFKKIGKCIFCKKGSCQKDITKKQTAQLYQKLVDDYISTSPY